MMSRIRTPGVRAKGAARTPLLLGMLLLAACGEKDSPADAPAAPRGPTLSWEAVPGATGYGVFVFDPPARAPVWIWEGPSTTVRFGERAISISPAPRPLSDRAEYGIVAFDAAGGIVGVLERRKVQ